MTYIKTTMEIKEQLSTDKYYIVVVCWIRDYKYAYISFTQPGRGKENNILPRNHAQERGQVGKQMKKSQTDGFFFNSVDFF